MSKNTGKDFKVGIFVTLGLAFSMVAILVLGGAESAFTPKRKFITHFPNASGILVGSKVVLSGIPVGTVKKVDFDMKTKNIEVTLGVELGYADHVTQGATAEILTQGVLGDKYVAINPGESSTALKEGDEIPNISSNDLMSFLSKSDQLMVNLNSAVANLDVVLKALNKGNRFDTIMMNLSNASLGLSNVASALEAKNLNKTTKNLGDIMEKVNNGVGTLGALVNDSRLYEDARALVGGANRNRIIRNLVRKSAKDGAEKSEEEPK